MLVYPVPIRSWKLRGEVGIQNVDTSVDLDLFNIQAVFVFFSRRQFANNQHNLNMEKKQDRLAIAVLGDKCGVRALHASQVFAGML